jgi:hypothetical protein
MSSTEIAVQTTTIADQMEFARMVVAQPSGGAASILPDSYKGNPANVLIAIGLGASMGLSPAESLYRISVIKGKPAAGAELIASNVRKAGHRLRVRGDDASCTATIIRADDPDYEFTITRDLEWARSMGLASNDNYRKQPGTMLQWRAITAVARLACPESLYGVVYSDEEATEIDVSTQPRRVTASEILSHSSSDSSDISRDSDENGSTIGSDIENDTPNPSEKNMHPARVVEEIPSETQPKSAKDRPDYKGITPAQTRMMNALFNEKKITNRDDKLAYCEKHVQAKLTSSSELSEAEASLIIKALTAETGAE